MVKKKLEKQETTWEFWCGPGGGATFLASNDSNKEYCKIDGLKLIKTFEAKTVDEAFKKHDEFFKSYREGSGDNNVERSGTKVKKKK